MVHGVAHGWRHILHFRNVSTECIPAVSSHSRNSVLLVWIGKQSGCSHGAIHRPTYRLERALTLRFVASWPKPVDESQKARSQHRSSKMKVLFATLAVSITAHSVKLVQPQLTFGELVKPLVNNALCWARSTVRPVSQWWSTTCKMRNTMDHLLWVRQVTRWTCSMTQAHPIYGCPTPIVTMVLKSQFLPQLQIKHLRRQRQHIQNRVRFGSSVRLLLRGHCE